LYGILCWVPAVSFITMTSLWRHLSTLNVATLPLKGSCNEQYSVIRFLWAKASAYVIIHPELCPVHSDKCFTKPAINAWCYEFTNNSQESVINKERSGPSVVLTAARSFFIDNTFLTMSKTSWIKMCIVDLVKHFWLYTLVTSKSEWHLCHVFLPMANEKKNVVPYGILWMATSPHLMSINDVTVTSSK